MNIDKNKILIEQASIAQQKEDLNLAESIYLSLINNTKNKLSQAEKFQALYQLGMIYLATERYLKAADALKKALKFENKNADLQYHFALALMQSNSYKEASQAFQNAININPLDADYYFYYANTLVKENRIHQAIENYIKALNIQANDIEIIINLANAYRMNKQIPLAQKTFESAIAKNNKNAELYYEYAIFIKFSNQQKALNLIEKAIQLSPQQRYYRLELAEILYLSANYVDSLKIFKAILNKDKYHLQANLGVSKCLAEMHLVPEAIMQIKSLLNFVDRQFENDEFMRHQKISILIKLANLYFRIQQSNLAKSVILQAKSLDESQAFSSQLNFQLALYYDYQGDFSSSQPLLLKCWQKPARLSEAIYHLSLKGDFNVGEEIIDEIQQQLASVEPLSKQAINLNFALAKFYEKNNNYHKAFEFYQTANNIKATLAPFNDSGNQQYFSQIKSLFRAEYFESKRELGDSNVSPIFIVGMPRSGSTLLQTMLAKHDHVLPLGEHLAMPAIYIQIQTIVHKGDGLFSNLQHINQQHVRLLIEDYFSRTNIDAKSHIRPIDKMLGNFVRLGLIALMFPKAKIIHCVRNPLENCWSCYTQNFLHGYRFTTQFKTLASFYQSYQSLMDYWYRHLPLQIINVEYEKLVLEPRTELETLLSKLGLAWQENCITMNHSSESIMTASYWQARQPIYQSATNKSEPYRDYIQELSNGLNNI